MCSCTQALYTKKKVESMEMILKLKNELPLTLSFKNEVLIKQ